jgi:hypothetical protein
MHRIEEHVEYKTTGKKRPQISCPLHFLLSFTLLEIIKQNMSIFSDSHIY